MASIYTVGQVNNYIKRMFNQDFALNNIYIKGEVSNCKYHTSGHIYFTLRIEPELYLQLCLQVTGQDLNLRWKKDRRLLFLAA